MFQTSVQVVKHPWLLPCKNGIINLKTGVLEKERSSDFSSKYCPVDYPEQGIDDAPMVWEKTLLEIFSQNQELVDFFQRLCGTCLVGEVTEQKFIVLNGKGCNGKSLIIETIASIIGEFATSIQPDILLAQHKNPGFLAPHPEVMILKGARLAFASEIDNSQQLAPSKIKLYSGNNTLVARNPFEKQAVSFQQSHTLFLATNNNLHAPIDDFKFWERMLLIPCDVSFVNREVRNENERKADTNLFNKLKKEYPQILSWMVKGCLLWQKKGLCIPPIVKQSVDMLHNTDNTILTGNN